MKSYFKVLLFLFSLIFLVSCSSTIQHSNKEFKWPRESFVKYETWIYKKTCEPTDPDNMKSECYDKQRGFTGSGSIVATGFDGSYILTAAHLCDKESELNMLKEMEKFNLPGEAQSNATFFAKHYVYDLDAFKYNLEIVSYDQNLDACVAFAWGLFKEPLPIAKKKPKVGSKNYNIAAPAGFFYKDLVPLFEGYFVGKLDKYSYVYTIPAIGGSSGSPIINENGELIGLIYARHNRFHHITLSPDFKKLRKFILDSIKQHSKERARIQELDYRRSIIIKFNN